MPARQPECLLFASLSLALQRGARCEDNLSAFSLRLSLWHFKEAQRVSAWKDKRVPSLCVFLFSRHSAKEKRERRKEKALFQRHLEKRKTQREGFLFKTHCVLKRERRKQCLEGTQVPSRDHEVSFKALLQHMMSLQGTWVPSLCVSLFDTSKRRNAWVP